MALNREDVQLLGRVLGGGRGPLPAPPPAAPACAPSGPATGGSGGLASVASMLKIPEFRLLPPPPLPSSGTFMTAMEARTDWWGGRWEACCRYIPCRLLDHVPVVPVVPDPWDTWEGPLGRLGTASWDASC